MNQKSEMRNEELYKDFAKAFLKQAAHLLLYNFQIEL